jgi:hypothetical protein
MATQFSLSREQFVSLLEKSLFPNPEGGPIGPPSAFVHSHPIHIGPKNPPDPPWGRSDVFHPGPIPWMFGPQPDPWRSGPSPDPWAAAAVTATVLEQPLQALQLAQLISNDEGERGIIIVGGKVQQIAEELCPTPPKFPWPWPRPHGLDAIELFAAGLTFQRAADSMLGAAVRKNLTEGADLLLQTGIERLQQGQKALGASA